MDEAIALSGAGEVSWWHPVRGSVCGIMYIAKSRKQRSRIVGTNRHEVDGRLVGGKHTLFQTHTCVCGVAVCVMAFLCAPQYMHMFVFGGAVCAMVLSVVVPCGALDGTVRRNTMCYRTTPLHITPHATIHAPHTQIPHRTAPKGDDVPLELVFGRTDIIVGVRLALASMHCGERARFIVYSDYAFGTVGDKLKVVSGDVLEYDIEVVYIRDPIPPIPSPAQVMRCVVCCVVRVLLCGVV